MLLLALALAPGLAISFYMYSKDRFDREPRRLLIFSFLLGVLSVVPAIILQLLADKILKGIFAPDTFGYKIIMAYVIVGISEECSKYFMLRSYAYPKKAFNEPFDGIIYSVMVSMGFATIENVGYVLPNGFGTGILRMFLAVPAHASFAVLMGYYIGLAKFDPPNAGKLKIKGLLLAIFFHGTYDCFLFLQNDRFVNQYIAGGLLVLGAVISLIIGLRLSMRAIRLHRELSKINFIHNRNNQVEKV
jgi:protease PrsW